MEKIQSGRRCYHISVNLLKGTGENYRWLCVDWPENRYLLIGLWPDSATFSYEVRYFGWTCRELTLAARRFVTPNGHRLCIAS